MSEYIVYRLKNKVGGSILDDLNDDDLNNAEKIEYALGDSDKNVSLETIEDWIDALKCGWKIKNPLPPKEEFLNWFEHYEEVAQERSGDGAGEHAYYMVRGAREIIEIIAKDPEHAEIKDWHWLKESEVND